MTTLKQIKEASGQSMACPKCGKSNTTHLKFRDEKNSKGKKINRTYRICSDCDGEDGKGTNITGLPAKKNGITY